MSDSPEDGLSPRAAALIFNEQIRPLITGTRRDNPVVLWVGGQPGAGKSSVQSAILARLGRLDAFPLDGDDLLAYHPQYIEMHVRNDLQAAYLVSENLRGRWWTRAARILRAFRIDAVISAPLGGAAWTAERFEEFRKASFRVEVAFVATHEAISLQAIADRYRQMKNTSPAGVGRWVLPETHEAVYRSVLATADMVYLTRAADALHIGVRGGALIHTNEVENGQWRLSVLPSQLIEAERNRPWTVQESAGFLQRQGELRAWLPVARWGPLLDTIDRKAQPVINPIVVLDDRKLAGLRADVPYLLEHAVLRAEVAQVRADLLNEQQRDGTNDRFLAELRRGGASPEAVEQARTDLNRERWAASMTAGTLAQHAGQLAALNGQVRGEMYRRTSLDPETRMAEERGREHHQPFNSPMAAASRVVPAEPAAVVIVSPDRPAPASPDAASGAPGRPRARAAERRLDQVYGKETPPRRRSLGTPGSNSPAI